MIALSLLLSNTLGSSVFIILRLSAIVNVLSAGLLRLTLPLEAEFGALLVPWAGGRWLLRAPLFSCPTRRGERVGGGEKRTTQPDDLDPCGEVQISHTFLGSTSLAQLASTNARHFASWGWECWLKTSM